MRSMGKSLQYDWISKVEIRLFFVFEMNCSHDVGYGLGKHLLLLFLVFHVFYT
jgi:hypothetical protein